MNTLIIGNHMMIIKDKETAKKFNELAREQLKLKLIADINMDMQICRIEWWDYTEYLKDLIQTLYEISSKNNI